MTYFDGRTFSTVYDGESIIDCDPIFFGAGGGWWYGKRVSDLNMQCETLAQLMTWSPTRGRLHVPPNPLGPIAVRTWGGGGSVLCTAHHRKGRMMLQSVMISVVGRGPVHTVSRVHRSSDPMVVCQL